MLYFSEVDNIYFEKSKEYFKEVLSCFTSGNYRSAMVMLYSVIICDLLFKLQELADIYDEASAKKILAKVEEFKNRHTAQKPDKVPNNPHSKSKWEMELVSDIHKQTNLLDYEMFEKVLHIHQLRNFSAHPALNNEYELVSPSKEETLAYIKCVLEKILVIPPLFIKNITDTLLNDLLKNYDIYQNSPNELKKFLKEKYYKRMSVSMKKATFKTLWKKCFIEENKDGIKLKRKALGFLFEECQDLLLNFIKSDNSFREYADSSLWQLCLFLAEYPSIYNVLDDTIKLKINYKVEQLDLLYLISWFITGDKKAHIAKMKSCNKYNISPNYSYCEYFQWLSDVYSTTGDLSYLIDYCIELLGNSPKYAESRDRYKYILKMFLKRMTRDQYIRLIQVINANNQIWGWDGCISMNIEIVQVASTALGADFNFAEYENFKLGSKILNNEDDSNIPQAENI